MEVFFLILSPWERNRCFILACCLRLPPHSFNFYSPDSWQAQGALTSHRSGRHRGTLQPPAPQGVVQGAAECGGQVVQSLARLLAEHGVKIWQLRPMPCRLLQRSVQGAVEGAGRRAVVRGVQSAVQWRSLARTLCKAISFPD